MSRTSEYNQLRISQIQEKLGLDLDEYRRLSESVSGIMEKPDVIGTVFKSKSDKKTLVTILEKLWKKLFSSRPLEKEQMHSLLCIAYRCNGNRSRRIIRSETRSQSHTMISTPATPEDNVQTTACKHCDMLVFEVSRSSDFKRSLFRAQDIVAPFSKAIPPDTIVSIDQIRFHHFRRRIKQDLGFNPALYSIHFEPGGTIQTEITNEAAFRAAACIGHKSGAEKIKFYLLDRNLQSDRSGSNATEDSNGIAGSDSRSSDGDTLSDMNST
jgi:hypothetical protein